MARAKGQAVPNGIASAAPHGDREKELGERIAELESENQSLRHAAGQSDLVREQFSDLYDYAPVGYLTVDDKGTIHRVNLPAAALLGGSRQELVGARLVSLVRPGEKSAFANFLRSCFTAATPIGIEVGLVRGRWRAECIQFVAAPAAGGRDLGHPGRQARLAVLDVSDRKRAEEALRESRDRFQAVVASMAEGVVVHDADGAIRECNTAAERILGLDADEIAGRKSIDPRWRVFREDGQPFPGEEQPAVEVLRRGVPRWNVSMGVERPDGTLAWLRVNADPLRATDGTITGAVVTFADVTAERASLGVLRESEERYRQLLELLPEAVVIHRDYRVEYVNRAALGVVGAERADQLVGRPVWDFLTPASTERVRARVQAMAGGERVPRAEFRLRRLDGKEIDVEVSSTPHADARGMAVQVAFRDVTEARREERELRSREAKLQAYLDSPAVGVAVTVGDSALAEVNDRFCEMLGYSRAELLARSWSDITHPEDVAEDLATVRRMRAGEVDRFSREKRYVRRDGSILWGLASVSCSRALDGSIEWIIAIVQDVTSRKDAEAALRRSEILHRTVASHFPRGVVGLFDASLRLVLNDGTGSIFARDPATLVGRRPSEFMPPAAARQVEEAFRRALDGMPGHAEVRSDGRIVEVATHPVPDEQGRISLGLVMTEDVTDRRRMQEQLQVGSRLAALGQLVAGVAHEINNPLAATMSGQALAIESLGELRQRALGGEPLDPSGTALALEHVIEALDDGLAGSLRIARIVKDLVTFGRPDPRRTRVRLSEVVDETIRWLAASIHDRAHVRVEHGGAADVVASPGQLGQALVTLVTNAVDAIPEGRRGVVTVRTGSGSTGMARLEVEDDGEGMTPEVLERAFDPFFTTREVGQGMGLGLSVAHAIATAHGGTLTATSRPGHGSTFRLELPAADPES